MNKKMIWLLSSLATKELSHTVVLGDMQMKINFTVPSCFYKIIQPFLKMKVYILDLFGATDTDKLKVQQVQNYWETDLDFVGSGLVDLFSTNET